MAEAIVKDKKRILPCAGYCDKEYGVGGYFVGVPCLLGANGVEKIIEVELDADERKLLDSSAAHVKELVALAEKFLYSIRAAVERTGLAPVAGHGAGAFPARSRSDAFLRTTDSTAARGPFDGSRKSTRP